MGCLSANGIAQEMGAPLQQFDYPRFYFDALSFATGRPDTSRLDVYVEIPYEMLSFTKNGDDFRADFEVTMSVYDSSNTLANEKMWSEQIETKNYDESVSGHIGRLVSHSFFLPSTVYTIAVQVQDKETKKSKHIKRTVIVRKFSSSAFDISDLMLVNRVDKVSGQTVIVPNVSGNIGTTRDSLTVFFEAYQKDPGDTSRFLLTVHSQKGEVVYRDSISRFLTRGSNACFMSIQCKHLAAGEYTAKVHAWLHDPQGTAGSLAGAAVSSHAFTIRWRGFPPTVKDFDIAIDQLQYIADKGVIDEMKRASPEKKREMFLEFWKKRNPTPDVEYNDLMEEYYQRVDYANKNFSHYVDGWKTDRGMVLVIFGMPNNIERHPFDMDAKPYEVWTYYDLNRQFVFVDATGFGDYRLQNPIWDTWQTRYH